MKKVIIIGGGARRSRRCVQGPSRRGRGARRRLRPRREGRAARRQARQRHRPRRGRQRVRRRRRERLVRLRQARHRTHRAPAGDRRPDGADARREQEDVHREGAATGRDARRHHDVRADQDRADGDDQAVLVARQVPHGARPRASAQGEVGRGRDRAGPRRDARELRRAPHGPRDASTGSPSRSSAA